MEITAEDRETLNKIIDHQIKNISNTIQFGRNKKILSKMEVTKPYDFILGMVFSSINSAMTTYLQEKGKYMGKPTTKEFQESVDVCSQVIIERLFEIKKAIRLELKQNY